MKVVSCTVLMLSRESFLLLCSFSSSAVLFVPGSSELEEILGLEDSGLVGTC